MKENFTLLLTVALFWFEIISINCDINNATNIDDNVSNDTKSKWILDAVWQSMVEVSVEDFIKTVSEDKSLYDEGVDPLDMDSLVGESLTVSQWAMGYNVNMSMWDLVLYGLTDIQVDQVRVERNTDLSQLRARILVKVDKLFLTGLYNLEAVPGNTWLFSNISSEGDRNITISLHDVKLGVEFSVGLGSWCDDGGAEITNINFPMDYSNMEFEFENSGFMLGALLDIIGDVIVVNEKSKLVSIVKNLIKSEVPSLLCEQEMFESTLQENDLPHHDESFMNILNKEGQTLIRDRYLI